MFEQIDKDIRIYKRFTNSHNKKHTFLRAKALYKQTNKWLQKQISNQSNSMTPNREAYREDYFRHLFSHAPENGKPNTLRRRYRTMIIFPELMEKKDFPLGFSSYEVMANRSMSQANREKLQKKAEKGEWSKTKIVKYIDCHFQESHKIVIPREETFKSHLVAIRFLQENLLDDYDLRIEFIPKKQKRTPKKKSS